MTKSEFLQKLSVSFPGMKSGPIADIGEFVGLFSEDNVGRLWRAFEVDYLLQSPPRKGHLIKVALDNAIPTEIRSITSRYEYVCYVCGCRYPMIDTKCPTCLNTDKTWRSVIQVGAKRSGMLKGEIEREREAMLNARTGGVR